MQDRSPQLLGSGMAFLVASWVVFGLRIYVRVVKIRNFGWDDWLMGFCVFCYTAYITCQTGGIVFGTGRHLQDLNPDRAQTALTFWWFCELFYILCAMFLKLSVGVFLHRVANNRTHLWIIRIIMFCTGLFSTTYFFLAIFQCRPISAWWIRKHALDPQTRNYGFCLGNNLVVATTFASSALNSFADWTFGILPIFIVKDLQMPPKQKKLVACILSFANIACVATIVRMPYIMNLYKDDDFLWETVDIALWSNIEPGVGIIAACVATMRPLLHSFLGAGSGWFSHGSRTPNRFYPGGKKTGSSGNSYALRENIPNLRPDYVGNYTEITAGSRKGRDDENSQTTITGKEYRDLYSALDSRYDRDITHLTPAAADPPTSSPPSGIANAGKMEIQKSVEFTFTEEVGAVRHDRFENHNSLAHRLEQSYARENHHGDASAERPVYFSSRSHELSRARSQHHGQDGEISPVMPAHYTLPNPRKNGPRIPRTRSGSNLAGGDALTRW